MAANIHDTLNLIAQMQVPHTMAATTTAMNSTAAQLISLHTQIQAADPMTRGPLQEIYDVLKDQLKRQTLVSQQIEINILGNQSLPNETENGNNTNET